MAPYSKETMRWAGGALLLALLLLVLVAALIREPRPGDLFFLLVRWPVWVILGLVLPLLALRVAFWRRRRKADRSPPAEAE